ncbi:MAG TPA: phosphatase PAP2 family protein [Gemmatimonadaceae bacterium]|nr:phosphatase PAP2 family protein [Gemmatimonadaceae bacterium]
MLARIALCMGLLATRLAAQDSTSGFFKRRDIWWTAGAVAASAALSAYDERIARWTRQASVQGDSSRRRNIEKVTVINEMPLTAGAVATYAVGRLTKSETVADVGLHLTESLVVTEVISEVVRSGLGRARPRASQTDPYNFRPGRGVVQFEFRAFPSLHAAVAFATAATLSEEIRMRKPSAARWALPLLYAAATIPGFTRLYLDQHWASDVLAGSFTGTLIGIRTTRYMHGHRTRLDRVLLGLRALPDLNGGALVYYSIPH